MHYDSVRRDAFALDQIVRNHKHGMTAGLQDVPDPDEDRLEIDEKGAESFGEGSMVEDRSREQATDLRMCAQLGVEVKFGGMAEPDVMASVRQDRRA